MATTQTLISVEEYLRTSYRPDCDYIDGEVLERNLGEKPHARLQMFFLLFLAQHEEELQVEVLPEQRVQVGPRRFRIPDVMLAKLPNPDERIVRTPPILCVEILSSEDRMSRVREPDRGLCAHGGAGDLGGGPLAQTRVHRRHSRRAAGD